MPQYVSNPPTNASPTALGGIRNWGYFSTQAALIASVPVAAASTGDIAVCGDVGPVVNNGTAWNPFATNGLSPSFANLTLTGLFYESSTDNITAHAGGGQASAVAFTTELNRVATVATTGDSVKLPPSAPGLTIIAINHGANPMQVFGTGTDTIDDVAAATGVQQMANSTVIYTCNTAGSWYTEGLASGFVRGASLQTFSAVDGLTAHAGGGQASATLLTAMMNRVSTVATGGDSTVLPPSAPGMDITVTNAAASNSMNVFPSAGGTGTETINSLGANAPFALGAGKSVQFICYTAGQLHTLPLVP